MKRTGECPECGKTFSLTKEGRLRAHGYRHHIYYASGPGCLGSGEYPKSVVAEVVRIDGETQEEKS